jgi:hydrid cluster protein-associated redox disulfide domain
MYQIEKETVISDILVNAPYTAPLFQAIGMHCLGCPSARGESLEQACMVHGVDADALVSKLNEHIQGK